MGALGDLPPNQQRDSFLDSLRPHLSGEALGAVEAWAQERVVEGDREALGLPRRLSALDEAMEKVLPRVEGVENSQPNNAYRRKVKDGHHHEMPVEGMDDQVSQGFGYQLDATEGIDLTRGSWPNNLRLTLSGAGSVGPFCFDYLVQPGWTGTEGKTFTFQDSTASFIIYSTLAAATAAAITAASTNGVRTIMVCSSISEGEIDIGGLGSGATIVVTSVDRYRVVITAGANEDIFNQNSAGGERLVFRNIGLAPASGKAVLDINTAGNEVRVLAFEQCNFPADPGRAYPVRQDGNHSMGNIILRIRECTGAASGFYDVGGTNATFAPDQVEAFDNHLALTAWWDGGSSNSAPDQTRVRGGFYTITDGITTPGDGPDDFHWSDLLIHFGGDEALFTSPAASDTGNDWSFKNIILRTTNSAGNFLKLEGGTAQAPHDMIYIHNIFGYSTVSPSGTFITVDLDLTNVYVSDIFAPEWPTPYSGPPITPSPAPPHLDFFNGTFVETLDADISEAGGVVTLSLQQEGTGDLTMRFSDGFSILDCTPAVTIALTVGDDDSPQANYIYILQSSKVLTKSTTQWPATEHIKVGYYLVPSAAFVGAGGGARCYVQQQWNDHRMGTDNMGHMAHMAERERLTSARYFSGINPAGTTSYLTIVGATVDYKATSGVIFQMHAHASAAVDTSGGDEVLVVNWPDVEGAYHNITNLFDIVEDSGGNPIGNNKWFNLVIWGVANKSGTYEPAMINLPSGFYNTQASAEQDISGFDNFDLPREFDLESSTAFLIARLTIQKQAGTWAFGSVVDLRRGDLLGARGGASSPETEFPDSTFNIFDATDNTKVVDFQVDQVAGSTTRTLTVPNADGTIALTSQSDGTIDHETDVAGQGPDDHHAQAHTIASHSDTTATGAELETLTDTSDADALHDHANHGVTHNAAHTIASHSDTTATGAELETLTDGSDADALHAHPILAPMAHAVAITNADSADSAKPRILLPCPAAGTITNIEVKLNESEECGATSLIVDVHKILAANLATDKVGTTIYTTQGNRPTVTNGNHYVDAAQPDVTTFAAGDWLAFYIDQVGTNVTSCTIAVTSTKT
jgi:hypothetical protein